jgi:multiple sugar transport system ATP-binding protein
MNLCPVALGPNGEISLGGEKIAAGAAHANGRDGCVVGLRPESLELGTQGLPARVEVVEEFGADAYVFCVAELGGAETKLVARTEARRAPQRGDRVALRPRPDEAHLFDAETGDRLEAH